MSEDVTSSTGQVAAQYDRIVSAYKTSTKEELWTHTTSFTFTKYVLDGKLDILKDASVLELGCGEVGCGLSNFQELHSAHALTVE